MVSGTADARMDDPGVGSAAGPSRPRGDHGSVGMEGPSDTVPESDPELVAMLMLDTQPSQAVSEEAPWPDADETQPPSQVAGVSATRLQQQHSSQLPEHAATQASQQVEDAPCTAATGTEQTDHELLRVLEQSAGDTQATALTDIPESAGDDPYLLQMLQAGESEAQPSQSVWTGAATDAPMEEPPDDDALDGLDDYLDAQEDLGRTDMPADMLPPDDDVEADTVDAPHAAGARAAKRNVPMPAGAAFLSDSPDAKRRRSRATDALLDDLFGDDDAGDDVPDVPGPQFCAPQVLASCVPGEWCSVTSVSSGMRVYCEKKTVSQMAAAARLDASRAATRRRLLSRPMPQLMREVDDAKIAEVVAESERIAARLRALEQADIEDDDAAEDDQPAAPALHGRGGVRGEDDGTRTGQSVGDGLWVNKYAPRNFMSLLSDEATNREVAKWVKSWDRAEAGARAHWNTAAGGVLGVRPASAGRPAEKVVLIAGPPGLGKTTLAHVVARHCGYHPFEINASDDRSAATLTQRVNDAVQMRSVVGGGRPNCVIIDEIDGATGGAEGVSAVAALLRIVNAGAGGAGGRGKLGGADGSVKDAAGGASDGDGVDAAGGKGKRGRALPPLSRPIICICNDLYAPVLRPLRDVAKVFHFRAPLKDRLVARLQQICARERIKADRGALGVLADRTDCDIRACLNTLQFLVRQHGGTITSHMVQQIGIGAKDATRSAFSLWTDLMQSKRMRAGTARSSGGSRMDELWGSMTAFGEYELLLNGLSENLLSLRFLDINFQKTCAMVDRLADADAMLRHARKRSEFVFQQYVPPALLHCHLTAAQPDRPQVSWPRAIADAARRQSQSMELLRTWAGRCVPSVASAHMGAGLWLEVLPVLKHLVSPPIRPLSHHMLSAQEQELLVHTAGAMLDYGVSFDFDVAAEQEQAAARAARFDKQGASAAAQSLRPVPLKPCVDTLHVYDGLGAAGAQPPRSLPIVTRQMIAQVAAQEGIRRAEVLRGLAPADAASSHAGADTLAPDGGAAPTAVLAARGGQGAPNPLRASNGAHKKAPQVPCAAPPPERPPNWLDALRNNAGKPKQRAPVPGVGADAGASCVDGGTAFKVLYRFNEGYTNAVKKPMLMKDLL